MRRTPASAYGAQNQSVFPLYFCNPVYFLYGKFDFLFGQLFSFNMVNSSFYVVNFLLFILLSVKCRLQSKGKVHTEGKMQTKDCRPGAKCSF